MFGKRILISECVDVRLTETDNARPRLRFRTIVTYSAVSRFQFFSH